MTVYLRKSYVWELNNIFLRKAKFGNNTISFATENLELILARLNSILTNLLEQFYFENRKIGNCS